MADDLDILLAQVEPALSPDARGRDELSSMLRNILLNCRNSWPGIQVDERSFITRLAGLLPANEPPVSVLASLKHKDLYLAHACLAGDPNAIQAFDDHILSIVPPALSSMNLSRATVDEVQQQLRMSLLLGDSDKPPRLAQYRGRGDLRSWVRVAAIRAALNLHRKNTRQPPMDEQPLWTLAATDDQELAYFKKLYRQQFKEVFHAVLSNLEPRERNLLRYHLVDGMSIDQIGAIHQVHRATAARWLDKLRARLREETRRCLADQLDLKQDELESIFQLVMSRFDASVCRVLKEDDP